MTSAEDLARTDSEVAALQKLREVTGESGGAMERHGLRVFLIADRLATARELKVDREVLLIAGLLHDVGLYDAASHGGVYVREGAEFTAELLRSTAGTRTGSGSASTRSSGTTSSGASGTAATRSS